MATRLKNLELKEVSLVKRGANKHARVLLHKSEDEMPNPVKQLVKNLRDAFTAAVEKKDSDGEVFKTEEDRMAAIHESLDLVEKGLEEPADGGEEPSTLEKTMQCTKCGAAVEKSGDDEAEDIKKGLSPAALALIEKAEASAADAVERVEKLQAENDHRVALTKSESILGKLVGNREAFAEVVKALIPEELATLEAVLKAANEQIATLSKEGAKEITEEIGKSGKERGTAATQLEAAAAELMKSDAKLTKPQAISKALDADPTLYDASIASK